MAARGGTWQGSHWIRPVRRRRIYARDRHRCVWCGEQVEDLTLDHLWRPVDGRYDNRTSALVTSCRPCNSRRAAAPLPVWLRTLRERGRDLGPISFHLLAVVLRSR